MKTKFRTYFYPDNADSSVIQSETTRCHIPEYRNLYTYRGDDFESHKQYSGSIYNERLFPTAAAFHILPSQAK